MAKHTHTMTALGSSFTIRSDDDSAHLRQVADYVSTRLEEVQRSIPTASPLKIAVLTALNIADELIKERSASRSGVPVPPTDAESREIQAITQRLISYIDESLEEPS